LFHASAPVTLAAADRVVPFCCSVVLVFVVVALLHEIQAKRLPLPVEAIVAIADTRIRESFQVIT
jgi:hypothetical protein